MTFKAGRGSRNDLSPSCNNAIKCVIGKVYAYPRCISKVPTLALVGHKSPDAPIRNSHLCLIAIF